MSVLTPLNLRGLSAKDASNLLLDAVSQGEGMCLEFKSSFQKEVIESLTAFANTQGGSILVGVGDARKVVGIAIEAETIQPKSGSCI